MRTHLEPAERLTLDYDRPGDANVLQPGSDVAVVVSNADAAAARDGCLTGGVYDWRGRAICAVDRAVGLKPLARERIVVAPRLGTGAWTLRLALRRGDALLKSIDEDIIVADLAPLLGKDWLAALADE